MASDVRAMGRVASLTRPDYNSDSEQIQTLNTHGALLVAGALPPETELARLGHTYVSISAGVTAVAALPTTAAHFSLYNGEPVGGKSYVISAIGTVCTTSAAAASVVTLLAHMGTASETNPAGAVTIKGIHGKIYRGSGNTKDSVTIVNSGVWHPVGDAVVCAATATVSLGKYAEVYGRYILPPGQIFSLATLNSTAAGTFRPYVIWHEVQLVLG